MIHGPNEDEMTKKKDEFWEKLKDGVKGWNERIIILGDANGRVGKAGEESGGVIGRYGEVRNNNGNRLIDSAYVSI